MAQNQNKQQGQAKEPDLNQLRKVRREKLAELVAEGTVIITCERHVKS